MPCWNPEILQLFSYNFLLELFIRAADFLDGNRYGYRLLEV
jgi:hypothetical protein